jgi:indolepyruvate ferredoxin oxidoreductase beta subunit
MSYEDVIRVADLKTRESRFQRVRREVGAQPGQLVKVVEFLKPGLDEFCSVLPGLLARPVLHLAQRSGLENRLNIGLKIKTTSVGGFLLLKCMSSLRRWRRVSSRFAEEQAMIERWLAAIREAAAKDLDLALEIAECARLVKGYGETHRRGLGNFVAILDNLVETDATLGDRKAAIRAARDAALGDPDGKALRSLLAEIRAGGSAASAEDAPRTAAAASV